MGLPGRHEVLGSNPCWCVIFLAENIPGLAGLLLQSGCGMLQVFRVSANLGSRRRDKLAPDPTRSRTIKTSSHVKNAPTIRSLFVLIMFPENRNRSKMYCWYTHVNFDWKWALLVSLIFCKNSHWSFLFFKNGSLTTEHVKKLFKRIQVIYLPDH